jgi:hypothetical protein
VGVGELEQAGGGDHALAAVDGAGGGDRLGPVHELPAVGLAAEHDPRTDRQRGLDARLEGVAVHPGAVAAAEVPDRPAGACPSQGRVLRRHHRHRDAKTALRRSTHRLA